MKTSSFTEEQIAFAIKQYQLGTRVEEICPPSCAKAHPPTIQKMVGGSN